MPVECTPAMNCPSKRASREASARYRVAKSSLSSATAPLSHGVRASDSGFRTRPSEPSRTADATLVLVLEELRRELGDALITDAAALDALRADKSGQRSGSAPLALVEAREVAHVQAALRWASAHGVPVVPRGAGTGLAGGAIAGSGELVVSTARMTRILRIDAA